MNIPHKVILPTPAMEGFFLKKSCFPKRAKREKGTIETGKARYPGERQSRNGRKTRPSKQCEFWWSV